MNWKLIFQLSMFGLAMGIGTVFVIPSNFEPLFWLLVFAICAAIIAKKCQGKYFLHGLMVSLVNSVWVTGAHVLFFNSYAARHASEIAMIATTPLADRPRLLMMVLTPLFGIASGIILGLFAYAGSLLRKYF